jgi:hypothetical protein
MIGRPPRPAAFCAIENPLAGSDIIRMAQKVAFPGGQPPPEKSVLTRM